MAAVKPDRAMTVAAIVVKLRDPQLDYMAKSRLRGRLKTLSRDLTPYEREQVHKLVGWR